MTQEKKIVKSISRVVKNSRKQSGWSVKKLASKTGLTQQTIHNIETGDTDRVDLVKITKIANALEFSITDLLSQTTSTNSNPFRQADTIEKIPEIPFTFHQNGDNIGVYAVPGLTDVGKKVISENEVIVDIKAFTIEAWIFPIKSANLGEEKIIALSPSKWNEIYIGWEKDRVWFGVVPNDEQGWMRLRSQPIPLFEWHHVVAKSDGITASLFIDQLEVGRLDLLQDFSTYKILGRIFVGCLGYEHDELKEVDRFFSGHINQPRIWNNALDPFDLKEIRSINLF